MKAGSHKSAKKNDKTKLKGTKLKQKDSSGFDFDRPHKDLCFLKLLSPHNV